LIETNTAASLSGLVIKIGSGQLSKRQKPNHLGLLWSIGSGNGGDETTIHLIPQ